MIGSFAKGALGALTGLMMSAALAGQASAATVIPDSATVAPGSDVTFTVSEEVVDLLGFDIGLNYDTTKLQLGLINLGTDLPWEPGAGATLGGAPGAFTLSFAGCCSGFTSVGPTVLFTATFKALSAGPATLDVTANSSPFSGPFSFYYTDSSSASVPVAGFGTTTITGVAAIPEPATWLMLILGFGIAGAALRSGRKRTLALA